MMKSLTAVMLVRAIAEGKLKNEITPAIIRQSKERPRIYWRAIYRGKSLFERNNHHAGRGCSASHQVRRIGTHIRVSEMIGIILNKHNKIGDCIQ
jgi:hypothetical protein